MLDAFEKIYHLRKSLNEWEEKVGIRKFNKNSRIILTAIHTLQKLLTNRSGIIFKFRKHDCKISSRNFSTIRIAHDTTVMAYIFKY